jgi:predicted DNA-binding mobile mystery protein A
MKRELREHARQTLDERLSGLKPTERYLPPSKGWIRAIRDALGMTGSQLAARLGVRPQTIDAIEKSEARGNIQLGTLRRAAEAVDCTLVYALVPNASLEGAVYRRARAMAVRDLQRVAHTMKLEAQQTDAAGFEERVGEYIRDAIDERDLWNEP